METASMNGFIRTLLIIVCCYYVFKFLLRIFAPILMKKAVEKVQQKMNDQMNAQFNQQTNTSQQSQNTQSNTSFPKEKKKVGDYVDFEEID